MRASKDGQPTGAIAFLGSTINQSWNSPMEGQDEMTNILSEADSNNIKRTFAGISMNGCMKMIDSYGTDGAQMADTWTVFGDPTIMVRSAVPQPLTAQYDTMLFVSDSTLAVYCNMEGARVTATIGDSILATGLIANDTVILTFPALTIPFDTLHLVVTAYNMIPYMSELVVRDIPVPMVAGFTGLPNRVVPGHSVAFADTSIGMATSWSWHFPGGTPGFSTEQNPVVTYDTLGTYDVTLVVSNGFTSDSTTGTGYIVVDFPAFTGNASNNIRCSILPNPSQGKFILKLASPSAELLEIKVFDMIGNQVYTESGIETNGSLTRTLNLDAQPEGVYFLKISGKQSLTTQKLVISR
jgi:PKD repeat protein